ncbi:P pilus assembly protein, pilin FimA [Burkholderia sp. Ch1-1]|nr:P pilus assembly protein, pilin FimA [Burkholderia sp. Ch1-1]
MHEKLPRTARYRYFTLAALGVAALAALTVSAPADAAFPQCSITGNGSVDFGTVTVPHDAQVGTSIGPPMSTTLRVSCPNNVNAGGNGYYLKFDAYAGVDATVHDVWDTNLTGIGIRVTDVTYNNSVLSKTRSGDFGPAVASGTTYNADYVFTYQFVKTSAEASSGQILNFPLALLKSHDIAHNVDSAVLNTLSIGTATIAASTCDVTTPSLGVPLPPVAINAFPVRGATAGNTNFTIDLSCQAGSNVFVTLTDATDSGNTTSNLTLTGDSTASGISLRVLDSSGSPVSFGPDSAAPGTTNQWLVGPSANTTGIPLTAQYISTGKVEPGTVRGRMTFTLSYQ